MGTASHVIRNTHCSKPCTGILIEDQVAPKSCGHVRDKQVVSRDDACARIQAAVDAREEGADILIVARSDARQVQPSFPKHIRPGHVGSLSPASSWGTSTKLTGPKWSTTPPPHTGHFQGTPGATRGFAS